MKFVKILLARSVPNFVYIIQDQYAYARSVPIIVYITQNPQLFLIARTMPNFVYITHVTRPSHPSGGEDIKCPEVNLSP